MGHQKDLIGAIYLRGSFHRCLVMSAKDTTTLEKRWKMLQTACKYISKHL